jgi:hypothetical protein
MSEARNNRDGKKALLEELLSIRRVLEDDSTTDEKSRKDETASMPSQIPLLQDIIDSANPGDSTVPAGLSPTETDRLIDTLVDEHVDEILELFKSILRDNLSLLMARFRDAASAPNHSAAGKTNEQETDLPDNDDRGAGDSEDGL